MPPPTGPSADASAARGPSNVELSGASPIVAAEAAPQAARQRRKVPVVEIASTCSFSFVPRPESRMFLLLPVEPICRLVVDADERAFPVAAAAIRRRFSSDGLEALDADGPGQDSRAFGRLRGEKEPRNRTWVRPGILGLHLADGLAAIARLPRGTREVHADGLARGIEELRLRALQGPLEPGRQGRPALVDLDTPRSGL